jgi:hypothetical protein
MSLCQKLTTILAMMRNKLGKDNLMASRTASWFQVAAAYDAGKAQLGSSGPLGSGENMVWVMPWAVHQARQAEGLDLTRGSPAASDLTPGEQAACARLYNAITGATVILNGREHTHTDGMAWTEAFYPTQWAVNKGVVVTREDLMSLPSRNNAVPRRLDFLAYARQGIVLARRKDATSQAKGAPPINGGLDDAEVQAWLKKHPDPDLWHLMTAPGALNFDLPAVMKTYAWIIAQPTCDRATAASLFMACFGTDIVGKTLAEVKRMDPCYGLAAKILQRSEGVGYDSSRFTLSCVGKPNDQTHLLPALRQRPMPPEGLPVPERLLGTPFVGIAASSATEVHSECWITRA